MPSNVPKGSVLPHSPPPAFTNAGKTWTYHRPGDPMPCDGWSKIEIICETGKTIAFNGLPLLPRLARHNIWNKTIGWRYAEPATREVELGPEDVMPGSVITGKDSGWAIVTSTNKDGVGVDARDESVSFEDLMKYGKINRSIPLTGKWNPDAWEPCSKKIDA